MLGESTGAELILTEEDTMAWLLVAGTVLDDGFISELEGAGADDFIAEVEGAGAGADDFISWLEEAAEDIGAELCAVAGAWI